MSSWIPVYAFLALAGALAVILGYRVLRVLDVLIKLAARELRGRPW